MGLTYASILLKNSSTGTESTVKALVVCGAISPNHIESGLIRLTLGGETHTIVYLLNAIKSGNRR